ncbi:MAG: hypothetical protein OSB82_18830, partial [Alphaproteobacteria bacterium]|nr:hypothetical protein [Alphaproteobacteria bacterium]
MPEWTCIDDGEDQYILAMGAMVYRAGGLAAVLGIVPGQTLYALDKARPFFRISQLIPQQFRRMGIVVTDIVNPAHGIVGQYD